MRKCTLILLASFLCSYGFAQAQDLNSKKLRVGVFLEEPCVMQTPSGLGGLCIEMWDRIMEDHGWSCTYTVLPNAVTVLEKIRSGELDVAMGPFSITSERLKVMDFSHPFHESGLQLMVNTEKRHTLKKLWRGLVDDGHIKVLTIGAILIMILTHLLLLFEWKSNTRYPRGYLAGFADCFYHVMSICMTGKSTHRGILGSWGKILAAIWLAGGVAVVAYITSTLTSVMTANKLRGAVHWVGDLADQPVGVIQGTVSEKVAQRYGLVGVPFENLDLAAKALASRKISAIAFDTFALRYFVRKHPELPLGLVGGIFEKGTFGLAVPLGSKYRQAINQSLVRMKEDGVFQNLDNKYFEAVEN
jgi:ABC-type amino acid transport substrate-binding protein